MPRFAPHPLLFGAAACVPILGDATRFARCLRRGRALARVMPPYERVLAGAHVTLLVAGDSTAVGTGARGAQETIAGLLAQDFPRASVRNVARVGARTADLADQLARHRGDCDAIVIAVGGNDVLRFTPLRALAQHARDALAAARAKAPLVVVATSPDIGRAPAFFWPVRSPLTSRTRAVRDVLRDACAQVGAHHVDFCAEEGDLFSGDPARFFAPDMLHPSGTSYRYCYEVIRRSTPLSQLSSRGGTERDPRRGDTHDVCARTLDMHDLRDRGRWPAMQHGPVAAAWRF